MQMQFPKRYHAVFTDETIDRRIPGTHLPLTCKTKVTVVPFSKAVLGKMSLSLF